MSMFDTIVPRDPEQPGPTWLDPATARFTRTDGGILRLELPDRCYRQVTVLRALPLSNNEEYLSVRCQDEEVGIVRQLAALASDQREMLSEDLEHRYFRPCIVKLIKVKDQSGTFHWTTVTDRGEIEFATRHPRHSVARAGQGRWIVSDLNANRYEINEPALTDPRSRRILEQLLA